MRFILTFLAGAAALALVQWALSDRTEKLTPQGSRKIEAVVTIHVGKDPAPMIPGGNVLSFLRDVVGLNEAEWKQIMDGAASGFISQVRLSYEERLPQGGGRTREIAFDVIDGKFSTAVGQFSSQWGPAQKAPEPVRLLVPTSGNELQSKNDKS